MPDASINKNEPRLFPPDRNEIILRNLDRMGLPVYMKSKMESLLEGKIPESSLICCNSGCNVCSETVRFCLNFIREDLHLE